MIGNNIDETDVAIITSVHVLEHLYERRPTPKDIYALTKRFSWDRMHESGIRARLKTLSKHEFLDEIQDKRKYYYELTRKGIQAVRDQVAGEEL